MSRTMHARCLFQKILAFQPNQRMEDATLHQVASSSITAAEVLRVCGMVHI